MSEPFVVEGDLSIEVFSKPVFFDIIRVDDKHLGGWLYNHFADRDPDWTPEDPNSNPYKIGRVRITIEPLEPDP